VLTGDYRAHVVHSLCTAYLRAFFLIDSDIHRSTYTDAGTCMCCRAGGLPGMHVRVVNS
jgi:hypothetical protein